MVVLVVEKASASLRGELSRWLIEPRPGIFVGNLSAMVRDKLWEMAIAGVGRGRSKGAMLIHTAQNEQGFSVRLFGETGRDIRDWDGLSLVFVPKKSLRRGGKEEGVSAPDAGLDDAVSSSTSQEKDTDGTSLE